VDPLATSARPRARSISHAWTNWTRSDSHSLHMGLDGKPAWVEAVDRLLFAVQHSQQRLRRCAGSFVHRILFSRSPRLAMTLLITILGCAVYYALRYYHRDLVLVDLPSAHTREAFDAMDWSANCAANGMRPRRGPPRRLIDAFTFWREFDMLELRLNELAPVVDKAVLMESHVTYSGKPKPLYFTSQGASQPRFARFAPRLHVVVDKTVGEWEDAHARKTVMRSTLLRGIDDAGAQPDDLVLYSDLDEVPRADYLALLKYCDGYDTPVTFATPVFLYDFGCRKDRNWISSWLKARVLARRQLTSECGFRPLLSAFVRDTVCMDEVRDNMAPRLDFLRPLPFIVRNGGWHMTSFFSDLDVLIAKLASYADTKQNVARNRDKRYLQCLIRNCIHVAREWGDFGVRYPTVEDTRLPLPWFVRQQLERAARADDVGGGGGGENGWTRFVPFQDSFGDDPLYDSLCRDVHPHQPRDMDLLTMAFA